jgi:hypothetical protein
MNPEPPTISGASKSKNYFPWIIIITVLCILAFCFCFVFITPFNIAYKADAGFRRAKGKIDPRQLQVWATEAAVLRNSSGETPYVKIIWGGGFFHWFFAIGPTNFSISTNNTFYKTTEWTQGVYYSREGR